MTHELSNMLFTTAKHWSLWRATRMQFTTSIQKIVVGKCICGVGRQEITENSYGLWSTYRACAPARFML